MMKEVPSYYAERGGGITFCTLLDASKALDRLRFDKLFNILEGKELNPITLMHMHGRQSWGDGGEIYPPPWFWGGGMVNAFIPPWK